MTDKGFFLLDKDLNHQQIESIHKLIERAKLSNYTDARMRVEGNYENYEADWIKHLKRIPDSDKFTDEEICQGLDLQAKRISELEQAIKRIEEAYLEVKAANDFSNEKCPSVEMAHEANKLMDQAIADAEKMVGER